MLHVRWAAASTAPACAGRPKRARLTLPRARPPPCAAHPGQMPHTSPWRSVEHDGPQQATVLLQVLAREPLKVVNSFSEVLDTTLEETSYPALCRIVSELRALGCCPDPICTPATVCSYPVLGAVVARFRPCFCRRTPATASGLVILSRTPAKDVASTYNTASLCLILINVCDTCMEAARGTTASHCLRHQPPAASPVSMKLT